jgi:hypothetical protein
MAGQMSSAVRRRHGQDCRAFAADSVADRAARVPTRPGCSELTRELAAQVETAIRDSRAYHLHIAVVFGGGYGRQNEAPKRGVMSPWRRPAVAAGHMEQGNCHLDHVQHLVLDEADRMLDMGFMPDNGASFRNVRAIARRRCSPPPS